MFKKTLNMVIIIVLLAASLLLVIINMSQVSAENPIVLSKAENLKGYMLQSKRQWEEPENVIHRVAVIRDEPDLLQVKVDFKYSGDHGMDVSTCGGVHKDLQSYNQSWSCVPTRLRKGEQSAILKFKLIDDRTGDKKCSEALAIAFYKHGGSDFHRDYYLYKKSWIKGKTGFLSRIKQYFHLKTSCS